MSTPTNKRIADLLAIAAHTRQVARAGRMPSVPMPKAADPAHHLFETVPTIRPTPAAAVDAATAEVDAFAAQFGKVPAELQVVGATPPAPAVDVPTPTRPPTADEITRDSRAAARQTLQMLRDAGIPIFDPDEEARLYPDGQGAADVEDLPVLVPKAVDAESEPVVEAERKPMLVADVRDTLTFLAQPGEGEHRTLQALLTQMQRLDASDLHLIIGEPPAMRIANDMRRLDHAPLEWEHMRSFVYAVVTEHDLKRMDALSRRYQEEERAGDNDVLAELDVIYEYAGARYRCHVSAEHRGVSLSMRRLPSKPMTIKDLRLPSSVAEACDAPSGLILVAGVTGSGKTTTQAALINHIARLHPYHIVTIEDPVEYMFPRGLYPSLIRQRQVGRDTITFANGVKAALRQDPDIIVIGELLDAETTRLALQAAQTGHLVFATIHAESAAGVPQRVYDFFPPDQGTAIAQQLASVLRLWTFQQILPRVTGGRVPVFAVTPISPAIRKNIAERDITNLPTSCQQAARDDRGVTLEESVEYVIKHSIVEPDLALAVLPQDERERLADKLRT